MPDPFAPPGAAPDPVFDHPVFIVSPPRSGSSVLFETLARSTDAFTVGGESHAVIEQLAPLHPISRDWDSNRLTEDDADPAVLAALRARFYRALRDGSGAKPRGGRVRIIEKTPKNALRLPFLLRAFPEALFLYLHRDPRAVLASMMEAWESGRFKTYAVPGWPGPLAWSLLLVPGWRELKGKPLSHVVAMQWLATTRILLNDLGQVPPERRLVCRYDDFVASPDEEVARLCSAFGWRKTAALGPRLDPSRHTVSPPEPEKWRRRAPAIDAVWPLLEEEAARAAAFAAA